MQASCPRTIICPVTFGLDVQVDFGIKWLANHLQRLGLWISYDEVTWYKQSAVRSSTTESSNPDMEDKAFVQWVADNVDHNHVTLTSKGTCHEMFLISVSPLQMVKDVLVQCLTERRIASDFVKKGEYQLCNTLEKAIMDC